MKITAINEEPYGDILCRYFQQEFPGVSVINNADLLEILSSLIIGTKETRYGAIPAPEALVVIRSAIRNAIDKQIPIPILVPWGSIKSNFSAHLDIAEVSAINRLITLNRQIKRYYSKGAEIVIRVEDTSGYELFSTEPDQERLRKSIDLYSKSFANLVAILSSDLHVRVRLESDMKYASNFHAISEINTALIKEYLMESKESIIYAPETVTRLNSYAKLNDAGWTGIISQEQRQHYISTYERLYGDATEEKQIDRLAHYLGGALTRRHLDMYGNMPYWTEYIQLVFVPPTKGLPEGYNNRYVYYRTLPLSSARTHIPAWRAKGYFKICGNTITPKLTTFSDSELTSKLIPSYVELREDDVCVRIDTDYLLED